MNPTDHEATPERLGSSLAVRYRPSRFAEVVGQRHVTAVLGRALANERLPAQLLFSGGSGLGKTTLARVTAAALLCETALDQRPQADACGTCGSCLDITTPGRMHPDVVEFDAASHGGKDEIRAIAERASLSPLRGAKKVYIIDEAHGLSGPGGQAFLKLLEEPPPHVVFMLATTDPDKMLATNRGRCTEFELLAPTDTEMAANLLRVSNEEGWELSEPAALAIVAASDPALGVRATLMSLEKLSHSLDDGVELSPDEVAELLNATRPKDLADLLDAIVSLDAAAAFAALATIRGTATDDHLFDSLISWAKTELLSAPPDRFEMARFRLATLVERPRSSGQLELALAALCRPEQLTAPEVLPSLLEQAAEVVADLAAAIRDARAAVADLGAGVTDEQTVAPPELSSTRESGDEGVEAPLPTADDPAPDPTDPDPTEPALSTADEVALVDPEQFIESVASYSPRAAALLRTCALRAIPGVMKIAAPTSTQEPLRALGEPLRTAAAELGITLTLATLPDQDTPRRADA